MNWFQRLGVLSLILATALGVGTWATTVNHAVNPVPIANLGLTEDAAEETREFVTGLEPLQIVGADSDADNRTKRVALGAALLEANGGKWPWSGPQEIGDCTSMGTGRAVELDTANAIKNGAPMQWRPVFRPWLYYGGRVRNGKVQLSGDGAVPSWAVEWIGPEPKGKGIVWADEEGVPAYSGKVASEFGRKGPPQEMYAKAEPYRVLGAVAIKSAQDACNAITSGYPVVFGSMRWGTNSIKLVEGRNVARDTANWPHSECASGYDGTTQTYGEKGLFYIDNSWGPEAHNPKSQMPGDQPGGYYVTWQDMDAICKEGMAFSISGTQGFPKRELDFSVFGAVGMAAPQDQEGNQMVTIEVDPVMGYAASLVLLAIGIVLLVVGRTRGNGLRPAWIAAILAILGTQATAAELDFRVFGDERSTNSISMDSSEPQLDFACFGLDSPVEQNECRLNFDVFGCKCGPECDCKDCDCGRSNHTTTAEPPARRVQWLMFSTPSCVPCAVAKGDFRRWLEKSGWEVSPVRTAHVRLVDAELEPDLTSELRIEKFPTFILLADGREVDRHQGYPGRKHLVDKLTETVKQLPILNEKPKVVRVK